jgi:hypothetical protein
VKKIPARKRAVKRATEMRNGKLCSAPRKMGTETVIMQRKGSQKDTGLSVNRMASIGLIIRTRPQIVRVL